MSRPCVQQGMSPEMLQRANPQGQTFTRNIALLCISTQNQMANNSAILQTHAPANPRTYSHTSRNLDPKIFSTSGKFKVPTDRVAMPLFHLKRKSLRIFVPPPANTQDVLHRGSNCHGRPVLALKVDEQALQTWFNRSPKDWFQAKVKERKLKRPD